MEYANGRFNPSNINNICYLFYIYMYIYSAYIDQVKKSFIDIIEKNGLLSLVAQTQNTSLPHRFLQKV